MSIHEQIAEILGGITAPLEKRIAELEAEIKALEAGDLNKLSIEVVELERKWAEAVPAVLKALGSEDPACVEPSTVTAEELALHAFDVRRALELALESERDSRRHSVASRDEEIVRLSHELEAEKTLSANLQERINAARPALYKCERPFCMQVVDLVGVVDEKAFCAHCLVEALNNARAEVEMLRGVGCNEDGDGPCGACVKCLRATLKELENACAPPGRNTCPRRPK